MNVIFISSEGCREYKYWRKKEVDLLVEFISKEKRFIFRKAAEVIARISYKISIDDLTQFIFLGLTENQEIVYKEKLEELLNLLIRLYQSAKDDSDLDYLRTAVSEKFIATFVMKKFAGNFGHHCKINIDGKLIDTNKTVDVAGWTSEDGGEFHECKAGEFHYEKEKDKYNFLKRLKIKLGAENLVAISVFAAVEPMIVDKYCRKAGIEYLDRNSLSVRYLND